MDSIVIKLCSVTFFSVPFLNTVLSRLQLPNKHLFKWAFTGWWIDLHSGGQIVLSTCWDRNVTPFFKIQNYARGQICRAQELFLNTFVLEHRLKDTCSCLPLTPSSCSAHTWFETKRCLDLQAAEEWPGAHTHAFPEACSWPEAVSKGSLVVWSCLTIQ